MLGMPQATEYDLRFRALGIPVRVHPLFWLMTIGLGFRQGDLPATFVWVVSVFISILVHEYGHGLAARFFGFDASIVLCWSGGLCFSEAERQTPGQRLAVLISGPGAGFILAGLAYGATKSLGEDSLSPLAYEFFFDMIRINLFWGAVNLLPIWPLDGGQMLGVILPLFNRRTGTRWTHIVSTLTAGGVALLGLPGGLQMVGLGGSGPEPFILIFFGYLAFLNYQQLQQIHQTERYGSDDDNWWRR